MTAQKRISAKHDRTYSQCVVSFICLALISLATPRNSIAKSVDPAVTPTPGLDACCQCDPDGQPVCVPPLFGGCFGNCELQPHASCAADGRCIAHTPTPTPTAAPSACQCVACPPEQCAEVDFETGQIGNCGPCLPPTTCAGDCSGDSEVTIDEVIRLVNIAIEESEICDCQAGDQDHNCLITVDEIIAAVNHAIGACPEIRRCGGFAGFPCKSDEYCEIPAGACRVADMQGECRPLPRACLKIFDPVCGCDGHTYGNDCERAAAGVARDHMGMCTTEIE